jgi:hypothetical protein
MFPDEIAKIKTLLTDVLGRADTTVIPYDPLSSDPEYENARGKVLIQYDPENLWLEPPGGGCSTQFASIELWFEDASSHQYKDTWPALATQIRPFDELFDEPVDQPVDQSEDQPARTQVVG